MQRPLLYLASLSFLLAHCGKKSGDDENTATGNIVTSVSTATAAGVNAAYDATDALADDANSAGIALAGSAFAISPFAGNALATDTDITRVRTCTKGSDGTVSIGLTLSGSGSKTVTRAKTSAVLTLAASGTETRVWTAPTGQTIDCTATDGYVKVNWKKDVQLDGLKVAVTVGKTRDVSTAVTTPKASYSVTNSATTKGTRTATFSKGSTDASFITYTKTVSSTVARAFQSTDKDGQSVTLSTQNLVAEATPLTISITRSATTGALLKKILNSGTMQSSIADGTKASSVFSNLVFDLSSDNANKCQPTSGSITVSLYDVGGTVPVKTLLIKFGDTTVDSGVSVTPNGGETTDYPQYSGKGCDLETES